MKSDYNLTNVGEHMTQVMLKPSEFQTPVPEIALIDYFRAAGERLNDERRVLQAAIHSLKAENEYVSNKAIIIWLIKSLESTDDVVMCDILRNTLEIVVAYTVDDL